MTLFEAALAVGFNGSGRCDEQKKQLAKMAKLLTSGGSVRYVYPKRGGGRGRPRALNARDVAFMISQQRLEADRHGKQPWHLW